MNQTLYERLSCIVGENRIKEKEPMNKHTTFRVGGNADFFVLPEKIEQIQRIITLAKEEEIPWILIGNGSNLLVSDEGISGIVIQVAGNLKYMECRGTCLKAQAGISLAALAKEALKNHLTGFEFAAGIPGTLGGAITMNAGAYGGEMKDVLVEATILDTQGEIRTLTKEELELSYRNSIISREKYLVLEAVLELQLGDPKVIQEKMDELSRKRKEKQPLEYPSAGSTFKRPEGQFAGKLIQDAGLRGFSVGGAQVSEKHCGFIINRQNATAQDVWNLIHEVQERVEKHSGIRLEPEVKMIGFPKV